MKKFFAKKKLLAVLLALVLVAAAMAGVAFADNGDVQPSEENSLKTDVPALQGAAAPNMEGSHSHNYVGEIKFSHAKAADSLYLKYEFDPKVTSYNIVTGDTNITAQMKISKSDSASDGLKYYVEEYDPANGNWKKVTTAVNPGKVPTNMVNIMACVGAPAKLPVGQTKTLRFFIGLPDDNGNFTEENSDVYYFNFSRRAALSSIKVKDADGNDLPVSPNLSLNDANYVVQANNPESIMITATPKTTVDVEVWINGSKAAAGAATEVKLDGCEKNSEGFPMVPVEVKYVGSGTAEGSRYTLTVDNTDYSPEILEQPQGATCGKDEEITLSVKAQEPPKGELSYQWYMRYIPNSEDKNIGNLIEGADDSTYKPVTDASGNFKYTCVVTNTVNGVKYSTASEGAIVTVQPTYASAPEISEVTTSDAEYYIGEIGATLNVRFQITKDDKYKITNAQWYANTEKNTDGGIPVETELSEGAAHGYVRCVPLTEEAGTLYYYCVVTSTVVTPSGTESSASAKSKIVTIKVNDYDVPLGGKGTKTDPYLINTADDMTALCKTVNGGLSLQGKFIKLMNNITLPDDWQGMGCIKPETPIDPVLGEQVACGSSVNPFAATFDGNGKTITIPKGGLGLIRYGRTATVENLNIYGEDIAGSAVMFKGFIDYGTDDNYNTGVPWTIKVNKVTLKEGSSVRDAGLVQGSGSGANTVTINNCLVEKNVTVRGASFIRSMNGIVSNCVSYATVKGGDKVGGIAADKGQSMGACIITNCEFYGKIEATGKWVGGIMGAGYESDSAPNTPVVTIVNCIVAADISGGENVGGIFGGEPSCVDCWKNGKGSISENVFYGKINAKGENVGGIIGLMKSYNENQTMDNNFYLDTCGVDKGIGAVEIVSVENLDLKKCGTSATAEEMKNQTVVKKLNSSDTSYRNWIQGEKYPVHSDKAVAFELTVGGEYKNEYYIGEDLNLEGIELTARWSDGTTSNPDIKDVKITGYDKNTRGIQTVTLSYGAAKAEIQVTVLKKPTSGANTIKVSFTLLGDSVHGDPTEATGTHTLKDKNLETWIEKTEYTVDLNATVWDVVQKALKDNGMTCKNPSGNYIESITRNGKTLGEFSNGKLSGWMYTLNGKHPLLGVSEQFLDNGDKIVFHYTDDYTKEEGSDKWNGGGGTTVSASADDVIKLIDKIGTVTKDSGNAIKEARAAYDKLTDKEKAKVTNYAKLTAAEKAYADLNKAGENGFTDVKDHWAKDAINFVVEKQLFNGTTATTFEPETAMNRAMLVTVLWRLDGKPAAEQAAAFADVEKGSYYADAVAWANANGIVKGYSETQFAPNDKVTREQLAAILYRYAQFKGYDVSKAADLSGYKDFSQISAYAVDNMKWAAGAGIINGRTADTLASQGESTRAEVATMLMRFVQNVK